GCAGRDEQRPEQEADPAAACCGDDDQRNPHADEGKPEDRDAAAVEIPHAASRAATTITRQGACLRTKSVVPPKIPARARRRRGEPMTMICVCRRSASPTIARPARRSRASRPTTSTP